MRLDDMIAAYMMILAFEDFNIQIVYINYFK